MATSAVEKQTHRWRSVWQCWLKVGFVGSWLAGNTHLNTDSTEQQLGGKAFCAVVFPLVNLGRSVALMQLRPNKDELWDQTRATWFLTGPQNSHQPLRWTDKADDADDWQLSWSCCVVFHWVEEQQAAHSYHGDGRHWHITVWLITGVNVRIYHLYSNI